LKLSFLKNLSIIICSDNLELEDIFIT